MCSVQRVHRQEQRSQFNVFNIFFLTYNKIVNLIRILINTNSNAPYPILHCPIIESNFADTLEMPNYMKNQNLRWFESVQSVK